MTDEWVRINAYTEQHVSGATVSASRTASGWRFSAWAPRPDGGYWDWHAAHCTAITRAPGDRQPQYIACLGVRNSATEARALAVQATKGIESGEMQPKAASAAETAPAPAAETAGADFHQRSTQEIRR